MSHKILNFFPVPWPPPNHNHSRQNHRALPQKTFSLKKRYFGPFRERDKLIGPFDSPKNILIRLSIHRNECDLSNRHFRRTILKHRKNPRIRKIKKKWGEIKLKMI